MGGSDAAIVAAACALGLRADDLEAQPAGGGDISSAWSVTDGGQRYFIKLNDASTFDMFEAEADALREIAATATVRVPAVAGAGIDAGRAWLALEWLHLGRGGEPVARVLGEQLAAMHRVQAGEHGWHRDNTIGTTPQPNRRRADWASFWAECRLRPQLELAAQRGAPGALLDAGERLLAQLDQLLDHAPPASLLHGDLWGGNWGVLDDTTPVVFDPALYYGDREADLAMTRLFGGFGPAFYVAYEQAWPRPSGWERRLPVYQLYHVLNHFNLFGGGYAGQALSMARAALGENRSG